MTAKPISYTSLFDEVAATYSIHRAEAIDEVWDAIEVLWAYEDRPEDVIKPFQREAILEYIAEQYRTNRTRL